MENYETITVLFKRPGMDPEIKQIEPSADAIRSLVGGPFEASHIYVGPVVFFRRDGENEASLSDSDIDVLRTWLRVYSL